MSDSIKDATPQTLDNDVDTTKDPKRRSEHFEWVKRSNFKCKCSVCAEEEYLVVLGERDEHIAHLDVAYKEQGDDILQAEATIKELRAELVALRKQVIDAAVAMRREVRSHFGDDFDCGFNYATKRALNHLYDIMGDLPDE